MRYFTVNQCFPIWAAILTFFGLAYRDQIVAAEGFGVNAAQVAQLLADCPSWVLLPPENLLERKMIVETINQICTNDISDIQSGIDKFLASLGTTNRFPEESKIYVLNRMLFDVPDSSWQISSTPLGGFRIPDYAEERAGIWPLMRSNEVWVLEGTAGVILGPAYNPKAEFRHLRERFRVRRQSQLLLRNSKRHAKHPLNVSAETAVQPMAPTPPQQKVELLQKTVSASRHAVQGQISVKLL